MKNILIPTDFSDAANNAFLYALNLANQFDSKLFVLYSYLSPVLSSTHAGQPEMLAEVYKQVELSKFDFLKKQAPLLHELADKNGLDHSKIVFLFEEGTVLSSVKKAITNEEIELVVMGTYGASGFTQEILGTNTVSVIKNTKIPVLAVPLQAVYKPISKIAFTTLFKDSDLAALKEIVNIAQFFDAQVYCIHVLSDSSKPADVLLHSENWTKQFKGKKIDFVFLEKRDSVELTINEFIVENNIDLLAIVKRNRNFFDQLVSSSLSNKFAFHTSTPILVFHEEN